MARILIADNAEGAVRLITLLSRDGHELVFVTNYHDALATADGEPFDLIIIGVQFDGSQMYELLAATRENPKLQATPVMGFCETHTAASKLNRDSCESSSHILGACDYVDTTGMSDSEIIERINGCLTKPVKGVGRKVSYTEETPKEKREKQSKRRGPA